MNIDGSQITSGIINKHRLPPLDTGGITEAEADDRYVNESGDTMTGDLILANDPTQPMEAATKQYVDAAVLEIDEGTRILDGNGPPADSLGQIGNYYADKLNGVLYGPKQAAGSVAGALLSEPFNDFTTAPWTASFFSIIAGGRTGSGTSGSGTASCTYTIPSASESDTLTIGFAYNPSNLAIGPKFFLRCRSDAGASDHVTLQATTSGAINVMRGTGIILGSTAAGVLTSGTWAYVELQTKLHDTTGTATLRVNGTQLLALTNVDTKNAGTKTVFDQVQLGNSGSTTTAVFDDLYLKVGAGQAFAGDSVIGIVWPVTVRQIPAAAKSYIHTQAVAATTWTVNHNLGWYPNVAVVDSAGDQCEGDVTYTNVNTVTLKFSAAFSGVAYLS